MKPDSHRLMALDAAVILVVSAAICVASQRLLFMTVFVPTVLALRMGVLAWLRRSEGIHLAGEALFLAICTVLGAFNDWNSVCNKGIYDYTVPVYFPEFSTIPLWMLLFWGMFLRFVARLARWRALRPPATVSNRVGLGRWSVDRAWVKVVCELALVLATRQTIYRLYLDPVWSWLPFVLALAVFLLLFHPTRHDLVFASVFLLGGPAIEVLYIQVGRLHTYHLGWLGGVPLWIAVWWVLVVLLWKDLAFRLEAALTRSDPDK